MKHTLTQIFGEGHELQWYQMCARAVIMIVVALLLVRISGRRSFGMKSPFDNTITILLGAILSRGVVGASPFLSVSAAGLALVLAHRLVAWGVIHNKTFARAVRGEPITLFKNGTLMKANMDKALTCEQELLENVRLKANLKDFEKVDSVYLETNGEMGVVKKEG